MQLEREIETERRSASVTTYAASEPLVPVVKLKRCGPDDDVKLTFASIGVMARQLLPARTLSTLPSDPTARTTC